MDFAVFKKCMNPGLKRRTFYTCEKKTGSRYQKSSGYKENEDVFNRFYVYPQRGVLSFKWAPDLSADIMKGKEL